MNIIAWLRTPIATLIVLCSALLAQLPHAADVFRLIVMGDGIWATLHSYTYAIALELAVLLFVVQRRNVESYIFAVVSILVNLSYYYLHGVALLTVAALPAWLVSIALPAAIAQYSHLIAAATEQPTATPAQAPRRYRWQFWRKPTETPATHTKPDFAPAHVVALPSVTTGHSDAMPTAAESPKNGDTDTTPTRMTQEQRRAHIKELQLQRREEVMQMFNVGKRTADGDLAYVRKHLLQTNGVQQ
jgi:hypothetical protein